MSEKLTPEQEERLARYRAGAMTADERAAFERQVVASEALSEALYAEVSLDALAVEAREPARVPGARPALVLRPRRDWSWGVTRILLPAAAVLIVIAGVFRLTGRERGAPAVPDIVRGAESLAEPLEPVGELAAPPQRFTWTRDPGAESYRVDLYAPDGSVIGTYVTRDTTLGYSALSPAAVAAGEWQVVPLDTDGLERPATPRTAFRTRAP